LVGDPRGTNARSFDADPLTGRPRVLLNLAAHASLDALKISIVHESIHTFQTPGDGSFAARALREGEAVALTRVLLPATSAAAAMMWPEAKYATARRMREALLAAFRGTLRDCAENPTHGKDAVDEWLTLGHAPAQPPGAPDRSGYWIATLAAESWLAAHTDLGPRALLRCSPAEVFTTLR